MNRILRAVLVTISAALLPACGSGGGGTTVVQEGYFTPPSGTLVCLHSVIGTGTGADELVFVNPAALQVPLKVTDVIGLPTDVHLEAIDYRLTNGLLYAYATDGNFYEVDPASGEVAVVGATGIVLSGATTEIGMSFDPVTGEVRLTRSSGSQARVDLTTMIVAFDTTLSSTVFSIGYSNRTAGAAASTLYGIDSGGNLVLIGGVGGSPSPNGGVVTTIGTGGAGGTGKSFTIAPSGAAYIAAMNGGVCWLYTVNLGTGARQPVGLLGFGSSIRSMTVTP